MPTPPHTIRPRRLRSNPLLRDLVAATSLHPQNFVAPLFIRAGKNVKNPIPSMPGIFQFSPDTAFIELRRLASLGLSSALLFGITDPSQKDPAGSHALNPDNEVCTTLKLLKDSGLPHPRHHRPLPLRIHQPRPLRNHHSPPAKRLTTTPPSTFSPNKPLLHAQCGADVVAPSAMADHMVHAIRTALDSANFPDTAILSYAVKYASAFYGPFRDAAESPPQFGDRKTYQMDYRRGVKEALHEAALDVQEGADMLMIKPGLPYLDILRAVTDAVKIPTAAYHVSGEYAMLKAAAANGWLDEKSAVLETMHAFKPRGRVLS